MSHTLTKNEAAILAVNAQFPYLPDTNDIYPIIKNLSHIQIDTLSVVHRSHNHVLWTRFPLYEESMLLELQSKSRKVFEYRAHAMAYLPMEDYRFYRVKMNNFKNPKNKWFIEKLKQSNGMTDVVLEKIKDEGPLSSKDFENTKQKNEAWWDWKPAKAALEILFWRGRWPETRTGD